MVPPESEHHRPAPAHRAQGESHARHRMKSMKSLGRWPGVALDDVLCAHVKSTWHAGARAIWTGAMIAPAMMPSLWREVRDFYSETNGRREGSLNTHPVTP